MYPLAMIGVLFMLLCCTHKLNITPNIPNIPNISIKLPAFTADTIIEITRNNAIYNGNMTTVGDSTMKARGICLSKNSNPTITDTIIPDTAKSKFIKGDGKFNCYLKNLTRNTKYYVRAYATNKAGSGYGTIKSFTTQDFMVLFNSQLNYDIVNNVDNNKYKSIKIGTQTWMAENLKVTKYRNGDPIVNVQSNNAWSNIMVGAYCIYDNLTDNSILYGKLYNWYAVHDPRNLAPVGWHIPTIAEWNTLVSYLGGGLIAGDKLKEVGSINWLSPGFPYVVSNKSGFTGLPGGLRYNYSTFDLSGQQGNWWSSTENDKATANSFTLVFDSNIADVPTLEKTSGCSIRCIKDN
jgi:uncharacterized protein (TIGR02145 family)